MPKKEKIIIVIIFLSIISSIILAERDCLRYSEPNALGRYDRPKKDMFAISDSGYFYIHYDTSGNAAPDLQDIDGNNIPDYIDEVGTIADSAHNVLVNILGYNKAPFDGQGGYDIYIMSYAPGVYGYNYKEANGASYLQIDNDYVGFDSKFNLTPIEIMRITVGHEYFHGIQWGYEENLGNNAYFYEMTSMWFEDVLIPDGNDYLDGWADPLLNNPTAEFDNTGNGYELALFGHYLSSYLDEKGIESVKNSTIIREIWERFGNSSSNAFAALEFVLRNYGTSYIEVWTDFISRNLYNGIDDRYYYYEDQDLVSPIDTYAKTITDENSITIYLNDESVAIKSFYFNMLDTLFITHSSNNFIGRVGTVPYGDIANKLSDSKNGISIISDDEFHLIYSSNTEDSIVVNLFDSNPYNYSLLDINPNSGTYNIALSPDYFSNQISVHYFGYQT